MTHSPDAPHTTNSIREEIELLEKYFRRRVVFWGTARKENGTRRACSQSVQKQGFGI
jgi:hypothetical protein